MDIQKKKNKKNYFSSDLSKSGATSTKDERTRLCEIISKWNQERFSLFEISTPDDNLDFEGVIRFFYQDPEGPLNSKCIRVSSKDTAERIIDILVEKFRPDMKMLSNPQNYLLWEVFVNNERYCLKPEDKPILVQLNWNKDEREGHFLLEMEHISHSDILESTKPDENFVQLRPKKDKESKNKKRKSRLSFRMPKAFSWKSANTNPTPQKSIITSRPPSMLQTMGRSHSTHSSMQSYSYLVGPKESRIPNSSVSSVDLGCDSMTQLHGSHLMRTLSNPEGVLKRKRQRKMEQIKEALRTPGTRTIKIYAENLMPEAPYRTLLVTPEQTAHDVIKVTLEKYHLEKEDASDFCLVQYSVPAGATCVTTTGRDECIVEPGDFPLQRLQEHQTNHPTDNVIFQLRRLDQAFRPKIISQELGDLKSGGVAAYQRGKSRNSRQSLPHLFPMKDGRADRQHKINLYTNDFKMSVGSRRAFEEPADKYMTLHGADIKLDHCIIEGSKGTLNITPLSPEAAVFIDYKQINSTTPLTKSCLIRFGLKYDFQFIFPETQRVTCPSPGVHISISRKKSSESKDHDGFAPVSNMIEFCPPDNLQRVLSDSAISDNFTSQTQRLSLDDDQSQSGVPSSSKFISVSNGSSFTLDEPSSDFVDFKPAMQHVSVKSARQCRFKEEPLILPAILSFSSNSVYPLVDSFITEVKYSTVSFKLAPAYCLYMCTRSFLSCEFQAKKTLSDCLQNMKDMLSFSASLLKAIITQNKQIPGPLSFWISNTSEFLHFLKRDGEVSPHCQEVLNTLNSVIQSSFKYLCEAICKELEPNLQALFYDDSNVAHHENVCDTNNESFVDMLWKPCGIMPRLSSQMRNVSTIFSVLDAILTLVNCCRLNKQISIELFARLFHFMDTWVFNKIITTQDYVKSRVIKLLQSRINQLHSWGEKRGIGVAIDGNLTAWHQAIQLLDLCSTVNVSLEVLKSTAQSCFKLNSMQIRTLLMTFQTVEGESISREKYEQIDQMIQILNTNTNSAQFSASLLLLSAKFHRPFVVPDTFYSFETIIGIPSGLREFIEPAIHKNLCTYQVASLLSTGAWVKSSDLASHRLSESRSSIESTPAQPLEYYAMTGSKHTDLQALEPLPYPGSSRNYHFSQDPSRYIEIELDKGNSESIGINVVSYKVKDNFKSVILVKSVLHNPALDDGRLEPGDQIIQVDDIDLEEPGLTWDRAMKILKSTGRRVRLRILKKESVNLLLSSTNLYYSSDNELSSEPNPTMPINKVYPYATMNRTGYVRNVQFYDKNLKGLSTYARPRRCVATRYEDEFTSPKLYFATSGYPTFPRSHRQAEFLDSTGLGGGLRGYSHEPSQMIPSSMPTARHITDYGQQYLPYQQPYRNYPSASIHPNYHQHQYIDNERIPMIPSYPAIRPSITDSAASVSMLPARSNANTQQHISQNLIPSSTDPNIIPTTPDIELVNKLNLEERQLASSISQSEIKLQNVRDLLANIEIFRITNNEGYPGATNATHDRPRGLHEDQNQANIQYYGERIPTSHHSGGVRVTPQITVASHVLQEPGTIFVSPHNGPTPDVVQSTILSDPTQEITVPITSASYLQFNNVDLNRPMTLQDKMDFFIHKASP